MPIRIGFQDVYGNAHYVYQDRDGDWHGASKKGIPHSLSNYADDPMLLRFALEDAGDSPELALKAFRENASRSPAATARLI